MYIMSLLVDECLGENWELEKYEAYKKLSPITVVFTDGRQLNLSYGEKDEFRKWLPTSKENNIAPTSPLIHIPTQKEKIKQAAH